MEENPLLKLTNICGGAVEEIFEREIAELLANVNDVNTPADKIRSLTIEFKFKPFKDRKGAEVEFSCKSKLAPTEAVNGTVFFSSRGGALRAYAEDPRQTKMFAAEAPVTPKPQ